MLESASPLLQSTCLAGSSSLATTWLRTQHCQWQARPQLSWLEAACPFALLNLPGPYLQLYTGSLNRGSAAAGPQLPSSLQSKFLVNLNLPLDPEVQVQFTGKLIPIIASFNMLPHISKLKRFYLKPCRGTCTGSRPGRAGAAAARARHMI